MKMGAGIIWGIALILVGVIIVIRVVFNINVPMFRIVFSLVLIIWGVKMFLGCFGVPLFNFKSNNNVLFGKATLGHLGNDKEEANVIFGKSMVDLRNDETIVPGHSLELNVLFGKCDLYLPKGVPYLIKTEVAFGAADLPTGGPEGFGTRQFYSDDYTEGEPCFIINASVIFGKLAVRN